MFLDILSKIIKVSKFENQKQNEETLPNECGNFVLKL